MQKSIAHNTIWLTLSLVAQKVLSFVYFAILARSLAKEDLGSYIFAITFVALFGIIADSGLTPVTIREISKQKGGSDFSPEIRANVLTSIQLKIVFTIIAGVTAIGAVHALQYSHTIILLVTATVGVMVFDSIHLFAYGILRGLRDLTHEAKGMLVGQLIVVLIGWWVIATKQPLAYLIGALASGSLFNVLQATYHVHKAKIRIPWSIIWDYTSIMRVMKMAWPFALAGILARGYAQIDVLLLSKLADITVVATYSVPSKMVFAFQFIPIAMAAALYPAMSRAYITNKEQLKRIVHTSLTYLALIAIPLVIMLSILAPLIISAVFGDTYQESVILLQILSASMILGFLDFPIGSLLNATNNQRKQTLSMFITLCVNLSLNIALIPKYGALGATVSAVVAQATLFISGLYFARNIITWDLVALRNSTRKLAYAMIVSVIVLIATMPTINLWTQEANTLTQLGILMMYATAMGLVMTATILMFKVVELKEIIKVVKSLRK